MKQTARSLAARPLTTAEVEALNEHRLDKTLTYQQLAAAIGVSIGQVHGLLNPAPRAKVLESERTRVKVRRYLHSLTGDERATA